MANVDASSYLEAKARVVRSLNRVTTFIKASVEFNADRTNSGKRSKIKTMLFELKDIHQNVENDVQLMETAVASDYVDNACSSSMIDLFDTLFYELAAFGDVYNFSLSPKLKTSSVIPSTSNHSSTNSMSGFQLPNRKFPTFSGKDLTIY